ncbi:hypothetical protein [Roseococcus pinisoli]|uniref:Uncharacterized protein n=1 Tax=Roseococcus pinisoli TaxID=2835040 RepID=A0ABS5QAB6_9PROT|nr:hypothetical protein [Roseococcus pinisoli]MBS7810645.1 hypothetical protein [Roseococcus pinisoli]
MTSSSPRKLSVDPAWIALFVAALVLLAVSTWLARTRPDSRAEATPAAVVPNPLETRLTELTARLAANEAALAQLRARPAGDPAALAALAQRIERTRTTDSEALDARLKTLEDGLSQRTGAADVALGRRIEAVEQNATRQAEADQALGRRMDMVEQGLAHRAEATQAEIRRIEAAERGLAERTAGELALTRRVEAIDQSGAQRAAQIEQTVTQRLAALDQSTTQRLAPLQDALSRLSAAEARTTRLGAVDALRTLLDAGQPLGTALPGLGSAPPAPLARFATATPPTEAALRLSFEQAVRQARAIPASPQESLTARLNSLLTVRRGDEVIWGDASEVQIEQARRALEAGDLDATLAALGRLPEANRQALRGWIDEAQALVAVRAALRSLAAG